MKFIPKPGQTALPPEAFPPTAADPVISDIQIENLISDGLLILHREIHNLKVKSARGKLEAADARDLRDHLKLLFELKDREKDYLKTLSEDELKSLIATIKAPNETQQNSPSEGSDGPAK